MAYVIGIDGGGTKTSCLFKHVNAFSSHGETENSESMMVIGEATNPYVVGFTEMKKRLQGLIAHGMASYSVKPDDIRAVSCGLAGVGRTEDEQEVETLFQQIFSELNFSENSAFSIHSDSYIALRGALPPEVNEGILVISGTGSSAIGTDSAGDVFRSGGWGHILGDEGSGHQIGMHALKSIVKAYDARGEDTLLSHAILDYLDFAHPKELIRYIYRTKPEKKEIARLARHVMEAADQGDDVARDILYEAADELTLHVESLHKKCPAFHDRTPVMTTGSIFTHSKDLTNKFKRNIESKQLGIYESAYRSPAYGAALLARENVN
ncbi:N-acetylglucosamine kinase [Salipaludibacillus aurantiacus]|uniref:BadF-type ATPase n=1 Tax=Salipaludibacillus aurantiacus TaxID=1601833 RepID=A0A1H9WY30_9BACI|nr:BadF/BadG/BcrA/BcrD ATPase family protein [Salipaludibacillus aurantiacus]SES38822.1 BadF-type ATPase [Salipaludibacillus aurantiacus]